MAIRIEATAADHFSVGASHRGRAALGGRSAALLAAGIAAALFIVVGISAGALSTLPLPSSVRFGAPPWLTGWARWDAGWYGQIATRGYSFVPHQQSSVAFFPGYPLAMRFAGPFFGGVFPAGVAVTVGSGIGFAVVLSRWLRPRLAAGSAWTALLLVLVYPYAFYLFGAVYADALFVFATVLAFEWLETGHPVLSGLAGAVATATRPVGVAVIAGLAVRAWERRRGGESAEHVRTGPARRVASALAPAALSAIGLGSYCTYLWVRFGHPLLFLTAEHAWEQAPGPRTWLKLRYFHSLSTSWTPFHLATNLAPPLLTLAALATVPAVLRRFGWGYGTYAFLAVAVPALGTKDFFGMGRYLLGAFPCFAVAGDRLAAHRRVRVAVLSASAVALVLLTSAYARGHYVS